MVFVHHGHGGFIAALGKGDGTRVADERAVGIVLELPEMGVAEKDGVVVSGGQMVGIVDMAVGEQDAAALVDKQHIVAHHWEAEQHLVDLGIAVAAYGDNVIGQRIQCRDDALGVNALGDAVARPIVEDVAEDEEHVALLLAVKVQCTLQPGQTAVDVGDDQIAHGDVGGVLFEEKRFDVFVFREFAELSDGLVADLSDAFTLQPHLLCRLGERAVLSADAVESLYHLPAAGVELVDDLQQFGSGGLVFQSVVGLRGVFVGYDMSQAQFIAAADGSIDRQRMAALLLPCGILGVARHTVESCLLLDSLLDGLADVWCGIGDKALAVLAVEVCGSFEHADVALADQVVHAESAVFVLVGDADDIAQVGSHQFVQSPLVALGNLLGELLLLGVAE